MKVTVTDALGSVRIELDPIEAIGLYKMCLDIEDEDSQAVRAALQVPLSRIVGP